MYLQILDMYLWPGSFLQLTFLIQYQNSLFQYEVNNQAIIHIQAIQLARQCKRIENDNINSQLIELYSQAKHVASTLYKHMEQLQIQVYCRNFTIQRFNTQLQLNTPLITLITAVWKGNISTCVYVCVYACVHVASTNSYYLCGVQIYQFDWIGVTTA